MILKHRDRELLRFEWTGARGVRVLSVNESERKFLPIDMFGSASDASLWKWISTRTVPRGRKYILSALRQLGIPSDDIRAIVNFSRGLSLNDVYWIVEDGFTGCWKDYNLYENDFSEDVAALALTGLGNAPEDKQTSSPEFSTNGMLRKCWRRVDGEVLLYKGGTEGAINAGYEMYSEYYAAQIAERMELDHVNYGLSRYKKVLCSTCPLFTSDKCGYLPAGRVVTKEAALADPRFAPVFFFDALIFNTDRHMGNFGFLIDNDKNEIVGAAPIFDNGYGLFSLATYRPDMPQYHEFDDLRKYLNRVGPALYDQWLGYPVKPTSDLLAKLTLMRGFKFKRHKHYNLVDERLDVIESFIQERVENILNYGEKADALLSMGNRNVGKIPPKNDFENDKNSNISPINNALPQKSVGIKSTFSDSLEYQILQNMIADKYITAVEIADILSVDARTIERKIRTLRENGRVSRVGSRKAGYWKVS